MKPLKDFQEVRKYLARIPNLHNGGCGVAALAMFRWHKKNTIRPRISIALGYESEHDFNINSRFLVGSKDRRPTAPHHVGIIWADRETGQTMPVDARDFLDLAGFNFMHIFKKEAPLVAMIRNRGSWNHKFNRVHIARIAKRLGIDLSDIITD